MIWTFAPNAVALWLLSTCSHISQWSDSGSQYKTQRKKELGSQAQEKNWNVQQCVSPFTIKASPQGGGTSVVIYDQDSTLRLKFNTWFMDVDQDKQAKKILWCGLNTLMVRRISRRLHFLSSTPSEIVSCLSGISWRVNFLILFAWQFISNI